MSDEPETTETGAAEAPAGLPTAAQSTEPPIKTPDQAAAESMMPMAGGSKSPRWNGVLVRQAIRTAMPTEEGLSDKQIGAVVGALVGIAPQDEIEAMLAAQVFRQGPDYSLTMQGRVYREDKATYDRITAAMAS